MTYGIERRHSKRKIQNIEDVQTIIDMYVQQKISVNEISKIFNVNKGAISQILHEHNIHIRDLKEARYDYIPDEIDDPELLTDMYINKKMTTQEISDYFDNVVGSGTILQRLKSFGIPIRNMSEIMKGRYAKEKHPNWKGGITELYAMLRRFFHDNVAPLAWKRDNKICYICGNKKNIHAHHIKYLKDIV